MSILSNVLFISATCHGSINIRYTVDTNNPNPQTPKVEIGGFVLPEALTNFIKLNAAPINYSTTYDYENIEGQKIGTSIRNIHAYIRQQLQEPNFNLNSIIDFFRNQGTDFYQMDLVIDGSLFSQSYSLNENKTLLNKNFSINQRSDHDSGEDFGIVVLNDPVGQSRNLLKLVAEHYGMGTGNNIRITMEQIINYILLNTEYREIVFFDNTCNAIMINANLDIGDIVTTTDSYQKPFWGRIRCLDAGGNPDVTRYSYDNKIGKKYAAGINRTSKIVGVIMGKSINDGYYDICSANVVVDAENNIIELQILDNKSEYYVTEITSIKLPLIKKRTLIQEIEGGYGTLYASFGGKNIKRNTKKKYKKKLLKKLLKKV